MDPDLANGDVSGDGLVSDEGSCRSPDMLGELGGEGGSRGPGQGDCRIANKHGNGDGEEYVGEPMPSDVRAMAVEGAANRVVRGKDRRLRRSMAVSEDIKKRPGRAYPLKGYNRYQIIQSVQEPRRFSLA